MLVIKHLMVPIDFHNIYFPTMEVNGDQQQFASSNIFFVCVQHENETYTGLQQHEGE